MSIKSIFGLKNEKTNYEELFDYSNNTGIPMWIVDLFFKILDNIGENYIDGFLKSNIFNMKKERFNIIKNELFCYLITELIILDRKTFEEISLLLNKCNDYILSNKDFDELKEEIDTLIHDFKDPENEEILKRKSNLNYLNEYNVNRKYNHGIIMSVLRDVFDSIIRHSPDDSFFVDVWNLVELGSELTSGRSIDANINNKDKEEEKKQDLNYFFEQDHIEEVEEGNDDLINDNNLIDEKIIWKKVYDKLIYLIDNNI